MKKRIGLIVSVIAVAAMSVVLVVAQQPRPQEPDASQQPRTPPPPPPPDMLHNSVFPPEVIMQHQRELGLTDDQKAFMRGEINKTSARFNDLQWQLQDAMEALGETMKQNNINEQQALAQLAKVLDAEREIKTLHLGLAIRIKNNLTPDQQQKLREIQSKRRPGGPGHGPGHGPGGQGAPGGPGLRGPRPGAPGMGPGGGPPRTPQPNF